MSYSALRHHKYTLRRDFLHYNQPFLTTTNLSVILTITDFNQNAPRRYYGKDRVAGNGKTLPLETIIKTQTMDAARIFGLEDRGVLAAGMRADLNIIDMEKLKVRTTIKQKRDTIKHKKKRGTIIKTHAVCFGNSNLYRIRDVNKSSLSRDTPTKNGVSSDSSVFGCLRQVGKPYWTNDLPTDAGRWLQYTEGYRATVRAKQRNTLI